MKKTTISILTTSLLLCLTGCSAPVPEAPNLPNASTTPSASANPSPVVDSSSAKSNNLSLSTGSFNPTEIPNKIQEIFYGDDNSILVLADELFLYDTQNDKVTATTPYPLDSYSKIEPIQGGFAATGRLSSDSNSRDNMTGNADGLFCIFYDDTLQEINRIDLNSLISKDDFIIDAKNIAISTDGSKIAIASMNALSLYDISKKSVQTLLDFNQEILLNDLTLAMISQLAFVSGDSQLAFLGDSMAEGQQESITTYGTIRTDGSELYNFHRSDYFIGEPLLALEDVLVLPEDFMKVSGKLLTYTMTTKEEQLYTLTVPKEGRDGVYLSAKGDYFATAELKKTSIIVRIYERSSGKLLHEETVSDTEPLYFARIPNILLLDDSRTCIVLMGARQKDLKTQSVCFGF